MSALTVSSINKHQQKTEATRRKLVDAARRVFARDGFEAARIEDIAAEAGHSRGAFYANFESKEDLFFALLEQNAGEKMAQLRSRLEQHASARERCRELREFYLERTKDAQSVLLALEFKLYALRHPTMRARFAESHERIRASMNYEALGKLLPSFHKLRSQEKLVLEVLLAGLTLEHAYDPKRISAKETVDTLGRVFDLLVK